MLIMLTSPLKPLFLSLNCVHLHSAHLPLPSGTFINYCICPLLRFGFLSFPTLPPNPDPSDPEGSLQAVNPERCLVAQGHHNLHSLSSSMAPAWQLLELLSQKHILSFTLAMLSPGGFMTYSFSQVYLKRQMRSYYMIYQMKKLIYSCNYSFIH